MLAHLPPRFQTACKTVQSPAQIYQKERFHNQTGGSLSAPIKRIDRCEVSRGEQ
jgi:hypothetical protein